VLEDLLSMHKALGSIPSTAVVAGGGEFVAGCGA
jgi:hypothetical protein